MLLPLPLPLPASSLPVSSRRRFLCRRVSLGMLSALGAFTGCSAVGPDFIPPEASLQPSWSAVAAVDAQAVVDLRSFWDGFQDPTLTRLLHQADRQSLSLRAAAAQVAQARAVLDATRAAARPDVRLGAGSQYVQPTLLAQLRGDEAGDTTHQVFGQLAWELDFWGRQRRAAEADEAAWAGAVAAAEAARISLRASVASAYCQVRLHEQRIGVAEGQLRRQTENLRIARARQRLGATTELDVRQAETQQAQTQAQIPLLRAGLAQQRHALGVLLAETPDHLARTQLPAGLPATPAGVGPGLPRDLLRRRADIREALARAAAQSARIGVAEAALYPSFSLAGSFGASTTATPDRLFSWDSRALSAGAALSLPLFDRGRLRAQLQMQDAAFRQAVLAYQALVLRAQQEVEDALAAINGSAAHWHDLQAAERAAARGAELAMTRYRAGQTDYTTVVGAEQAHLQVADAAVQAHTTLLLAHIGAWRALGGDAGEPAPGPSRQEPQPL